MNARQLVTRARRRLGDEQRRPVGVDERNRLLDAFVAAAQTCDLASLERLFARARRGSPDRIAA